MMKHYKAFYYWLFSWHHLVEKPISSKAVEDIVIRGSISGLPFYFMLTASSVIATLGLLSNSAAVIIGAMIIAPLMSPIVGVAYWLLTGKRDLIFRSLLTVIFGTIVSIVVAFLITKLMGWKLAGSEIIERMTPNLLDLGVAVAAGAAAAFAYTRSGVSASFAGIAIAVALVPPLCTVGIALAVGQDVSAEVGLVDEASFDPMGPLLLYITNFIGIVFSGSLVFYWHYFRRKMRPLLIIFFTLIGLTIVVFPLGISMKNILIRNQIRRNLTLISIDLLPDYSNVRMRSLNVRIRPNVVNVNVIAVAPPDVITKSFIQETRQRLSDIIQKPVVLEVGVSELLIIRSIEDSSDLKNKEDPPY